MSEEVRAPAAGRLAEAAGRARATWCARGRRSRCSRWAPRRPRRRRRPSPRPRPPRRAPGPRLRRRRPPPRAGSPASWGWTSPRWPGPGPAGASSRPTCAAPRRPRRLPDAGGGRRGPSPCPRCAARSPTRLTAGLREAAQLTLTAEADVTDLAAELERLGAPSGRRPPTPRRSCARAPWRSATTPASRAAGATRAWCPPRRIDIGVAVAAGRRARRAGRARRRRAGPRRARRRDPRARRADARRLSSPRRRPRARS